MLVQCFERQVDPTLSHAARPVRRKGGRHRRMGREVLRPVLEHGLLHLERRLRRFSRKLVYLVHHGGISARTVWCRSSSTAMCRSKSLLSNFVDRWIWSVPSSGLVRIGTGDRRLLSKVARRGVRGLGLVRKGGGDRDRCLGRPRKRTLDGRVEEARATVVDRGRGH